jgi:hypothetical protein
MSIESFKPSAADLKNAEEMMTDEQKVLSEEREHKFNKTTQRIANLGNQLHDEWRKPRYREDSNDYEPRLKNTKDDAWSQAHGGAVEVDIANTPYEDLPDEWQKENKISAEVAVREVEKAMEAGMPLDESFIEIASSTLHDKWLERNGSWAPPEQNVPYSELSEEEKEKDRVIIRKAIEICQEETTDIQKNESGGVEIAQNENESLERESNLKKYANEAGRAVIMFMNEMVDRERGNMSSIIEDRLLNGLHEGGIDFLDLKSVNGSIDMEQFTSALLKVSEGMEGVGQVPSDGIIRENEESLTRLQASAQNIHMVAEKIKKTLKEEDVTAIESTNRLIEASHRVQLYASKRRIAVNRYLN